MDMNVHFSSPQQRTYLEELLAAAQQRQLTAHDLVTPDDLPLFPGPDWATPLGSYMRVRLADGEKYYLHQIACVAINGPTQGRGLEVSRVG